MGSHILKSIHFGRIQAMLEQMEITNGNLFIKRQKNHSIGAFYVTIVLKRVIPNETKKKTDHQDHLTTS